MNLTSPPRELGARYPEFYRWLLPRLNEIERRFPEAHATSWWRSDARNMEVGGAPYSQHLLGWAVDWALPRERHRAMVELAREFGLVAIDEGDHVHVQMYPAGVISKSSYIRRMV